MAPEYLDYNLSHYLDALAAEYARDGFTVQYQPFSYPADFLPLAASAEQTVQVAIDQDADFVLAQQTITAFETDGTDVLAPNLTVQLRPTSSQRQLQTNPVHVGNVFGTGERPHLYFKPLVLSARSSLQVTLTNLVATAYNVYLNFEGVKAFRFRG